MKRSKSSNPVLIGLIKELNKRAHDEKVALWRDLAEGLTKSAANRAAINIGQIARYTSENDVVAVPGKVLASGALKHPVTIAAFDFSSAAREKISSAGGKCISLNELMDRKKKGSGVKLME